MWDMILVIVRKGESRIVQNLEFTINCPTQNVDNKQREAPLFCILRVQRRFMNHFKQLVYVNISEGGGGGGESAPPKYVFLIWYDLKSVILIAI